MCAEHQNARTSHAIAAPVGFINRLPANSGTANTIAHVRDLQVDARRERDEMRRGLDSLGIGFWDWDIPSLEVWYSSHIYDLLGYDRDDPVWHANIFHGMIHPDDLDAAEASLDAVIYRGEETYRAEFRVPHKDGHWVWIEAVARVVLRAADGTALRMTGRFAGIDQRKQEQADAAFLDALTSALLPLHDATDIQNCALARLGGHLGVDRISFGCFDTQRRMVFRTNWTRDGRPPLGGSWPSHIVADALRVTLRNGGQLSIADVTQDTRTCAADKVAIFRETGTNAFVATPLIISGKVEALLLVCQSTPRDWKPHELALIDTVGRRLWDAVLRARAIERSEADKALLALALRLAKIGAREKNYSTGEITESENFYEVIGHPNASMMSVDEYLSHVHPEDRDLVNATLVRRRKERGDEVCTLEHRIITADEQIRHIILTAKYHGPVSIDGTPSGYSSVFVHDATAQRERELAADNANSQLLKQSRLSAMGVMASTLAHELNQPLATAANYLSLIQSLTESGGRTKAKETNTYIGRALTKVLEAGEIIGRIRSFTADGEVSAAPHGLRDLVFRALSSLFGRAGSAEIAIINAVPKAIMVQVEPLLVEHAISNVVRNAVDAMAEQTGGRLLITAVPGADTISLEIADNGPGIRADMADNIFSPFVTNKAQGTGLGLAISRTMVEAIGGKILLKRHAPGDTAFCLTLPRAATPEHDVEG